MSFKRSLAFIRDPELPPHAIDVGASAASFAVQGDGVLITARREGERLVWTEAAEMEARDDVHFLARGTFALALALEGWPLIRSRREYDDSAGWDIGGPEVLAHKIGVFEWLDRSAGFDVRTPRIPGLPYDEIALMMEDGS